jgi:uncharacterized protein YdeI (YjbR/CyaY-like superfamily)
MSSRATKGGSRDPRVDAYIEASADFAKPILRHLRELVHAADPQIEETMKWSFPHFVHDGIVCSMASFKAHCAFGFWKQDLIVGGDSRPDEAMGQFGRITALDDLPADVVIRAYVEKAVELNRSGVKVARGKATKSRSVRIPDALKQALARHPKARTAFERMPPSHRREYAEWIAEAKREQTRERRVATAIEWIGEGKSRNWKYEKGAKPRA